MAKKRGAGKGTRSPPDARNRLRQGGAGIGPPAEFTPPAGRRYHRSEAPRSRVCLWCRGRAGRRPGLQLDRLRWLGFAGVAGCPPVEAVPGVRVAVESARLLPECPPPAPVADGVLEPRRSDRGRPEEPGRPEAGEPEHPEPRTGARRQHRWRRQAVGPGQATGPTHQPGRRTPGTHRPGPLDGEDVSWFRTSWPAASGSARRA